VPYQMIEDYALQNFFDRKDKSTLRAKCRNIYNWYDKRDWTIPQRKNSIMSRSERAKKNSKEKQERVRETLLNFFENNSNNSEYKKASGDWNITKISKEIGLHRHTVRKHLKEIKHNSKEKQERARETLLNFVKNSLKIVQKHHLKKSVHFSCYKGCADICIAKRSKFSISLCIWRQVSHSLKFKKKEYPKIKKRYKFILRIYLFNRVIKE